MLSGFGSIALSDKAKVAIISPEASFGRYSSLCLSFPNNLIASVAR